MYTNIYCSYPYEIVYFMAKSTPLLFSRFGGFLTVSFFPFFLIFLGDNAALILKNKVGAADEDSLLIDGACDAVSHQILHLKNGTPHVANYEAWLPPQ